MRVVHLLIVELRPEPGELHMEVRTGPLEPDWPRSPNAWAGFLLGAGGRHVDYRLTSLVHNRPATDGGLLTVVDGTGCVNFRDNEKRLHAGNRWSISGKLREGELAEVPPSSRQDALVAEGPPSELTLSLTATPSPSGYKLTLMARGGDGTVVSRAVLEGVTPSLMDGGIGLVSHLGPQGGQHGHWFRTWRVRGSKVELHPERVFGPVLCTQYTLHDNVLKMTAQMPPLGAHDTQTALLQTKPGPGGPWKTIATGQLTPGSFTIPFRVGSWDARRDMAYRVAYDLVTSPGTVKRHYWSGTVREEPTDQDEFVLAAFTGNKHFTGDLQWNHNRIWFPHREVVAGVAHHDPDFLFFSGDQVYEGDLTRAERRPLPAATLDYLDKWYRWCWVFRELARDRPSVTIPDDHDVYHGNIWGAGGRKARHPDDGGYTMPPDFVNIVQRTQTSHLPDPVDPKPVEQGIGVYFTCIDYAGLSFAVIEDRKFKSSPTAMIPDGQVVNGWFQAPGFEPALQADIPGAVLLGRRQERFLQHWATDFAGGVWMKVMLSQTLLANVATLPAEAKSDGVVPGLTVYEPDEYPPNDRPVADADSNGWPPSGRNRALRAIRRGFALHVAGDQHLGSFVRYGVDDWDDAGYAFCVPSIANAWARRWMPLEAGASRNPDDPRYTGRYRDGFGNHVHVHAVANPRRHGHEPARLYDHSPGYGIVRFRRASREIIVECWPRWVDPSSSDAEQYPGWPIAIQQLDNYARPAEAFLPELVVTGLCEPVVRVIDEAEGEVIYALRIAGNRFRPPVFQAGTYAIQVGEPGTPRWRVLRSIAARSGPQPALHVDF